LKNKWIDEGKLRWCWLQNGGAALMLQEFRKEGHDSRGDLRSSQSRTGDEGPSVSDCKRWM
jgi:hypothetical protein